jgi:hypothetical protein
LSEPVPLLFDPAARELAERQGSESHFRWLALSGDPEAVALRAALENCFPLAGARRELLRKGLQHERWGQHMGALAHLLALGLLVAQGWRVHAEPGFGRLSPDILATPADGAPAARPLLVEVRSITGAGSYPWEARKESGRTLAHDPEKEQRVRDTVAKVLTRKAEIYEPLVMQLAIPYVIAIYEDKDSEIARLVREVAFGRAAPGPGPGDAEGSRDPAGGLFAGALEHVAAVLVFGRVDTPDGRLLLRGELIENPRARHALAPGGLQLLRAYRLDAGRDPPRMRFSGPEPAPFAI